MGCTSSKAAGGPVVARKLTIAEAAAAEKANREKRYEQQIKDKLYQQKELLREMTLPMMMSAIDEPLELGGKLLTEAQQRRKAAKLQAEAEQRWMVRVVTFIIVQIFSLIYDRRFLVIVPQWKK
jgi:hypothetical protein